MSKVSGIPSLSLLLIATLALAPTAVQAQNSALFFDGTNDFVVIPHSPSLSLQSLTVEGWVLIDSANFFRRPMISKGANYEHGAPRGNPDDLPEPLEWSDFQIAARRTFAALDKVI